MNMTYDYDFFVIGAGSGGVRASRMAAALGIKTAVVEESDLGGTCVNLGCVPKKFFVYASQYSHEFKLAGDYGWKVDESIFDWSTLLRAKNKEIKRLNGIYENLLKNAGVDIIRGTASIKGAHEVQINEKKYSARHILIAVGGQPYIPEFPGNEYVSSSNDLFHLKQLPQSALIVGGGYIAVEFAGILHGLGVQVTQVYRGELFLRGFDHDLRLFLKREMIKQGLDLRFNCQVKTIGKTSDGRLEVFFQGGTQHRVDLVLYATGRVPKLKGLGLENTKVKLDRHSMIIRQSDYQTDEPSIYAIGDVASPYALTPVAIAEGSRLVNRLFGTEKGEQNYENIPTAVFSQPNMATVGLTEEEAKEKGEIRVYQSEFRPMKYSLGAGQDRAFMKIIVDQETDRVLGMHMAGPDAGEIIQGFGAALQAGITKTTLDQTIGIHPTLAEEFVTLKTLRD